ncbi:MAG: hypothetical protein HZA05_06065 [Nitrospirae bacterium]|nr:hypothetical protein [Nitrospirota bacterium]
MKKRWGIMSLSALIILIMLLISAEYSFAMSFEKAKKLISKEAKQKGFEQTDIANSVGIMKDLIHKGISVDDAYAVASRIVKRSNHEELKENAERIREAAVNSPDYWTTQN